MESDLLLYNPEMHTFHITAKGRVVLRNSLELARHISPINELINKYRYGDIYYYQEDFQIDQATSASI
jgi:hypothetical protein